MLVCAAGFLLAADRSVVFPADGIVDVTQAPYGAVGDGKTDDTAAIQRALDAHANGNLIIFLPKGTYLVSDTLRWGKGHRGGLEQKRTILQGQGVEHTIIRLADNCPGYEGYERKDDRIPQKSKPVIWTGQKPAQRFRNGIRDLTVHTGNGNPGATGIQYMANNQGSLRHVRIIHGEGGGAVGLDLGYTNEQGPCLIQHVEVRGFDFGIHCNGPVNSITFEFITLSGQQRFGLYNDGQCISVRHFNFTGEVPALGFYRHNVVAALENLTLTGTGAAKQHPAILCEQAYVYVRNLKTSGFAMAIRNVAGEKDNKRSGDVAGPSVADWCSHEADSLFPSPTTHLTVPVEETPAVPLYPLTDWVSPKDFGGDPDQDVDHTEAIQKAVDSGKKVLYLPRGSKGWRIDGTVELRGKLEVFAALEGSLRGKGTLRVVDGSARTVWIDRLNMLYQGISVEQASRRTLVISGVTFGSGWMRLQGSGDVFFEDVCMGRLEIPKGNKVYARQLNIEWKGDQHPEIPHKIDNNGGLLWVLGYKTEMAGGVSLTRNGGTTQIFGGMIYAQGAPKKEPMLTVENARLSATLGEVSWNFGKQGFHVLLRETRGSDTKELAGGAKNGRYWHSNDASAVPLIVAAPR